MRWRPECYSEASSAAFISLFLISITYTERGRRGSNPRKLTQKNYVDPRPGGRACTPNANLLLLNYYAHAAQVLDPCIRSFRITFSL